jgi:hypothetical protein
VVAVDTEGFVFSWHMGDQGDNPVIITSTNIPFVEEYFFNSDSHVFYLAKTPADELILICVQGSGETLKLPYYRVLKSELDGFEDVDEISYSNLMICGRRGAASMPLTLAHLCLLV